MIVYELLAVKGYMPMFKDVIVPVIGGLGIFMLGLLFMEEGIQALAVNKMRAILAKFAGSPRGLYFFAS